MSILTKLKDMIVPESAVSDRDVYEKITNTRNYFLKEYSKNKEEQLADLYHALDKEKSFEEKENLKKLIVHVENQLNDSKKEMKARREYLETLVDVQLKINGNG